MTGASDSTHLRLPRTVRVAALLFVFTERARFGAERSTAWTLDGYQRRPPCPVATQSAFSRSAIRA